MVAHSLREESMGQKHVEPERDGAQLSSEIWDPMHNT